MERPNIVFINVDQMHRGAISALGNPHLGTPNLDRLARSGYTFRRSYCAMPQCVPARCTWMTGRMPSESGGLTNGYNMTEPGPGLGRWLREQGGYDTFYTGKWHINGLNPADGFDVLAPAGRGEVGDPAIARSVEDLLSSRDSERPFMIGIGFMNPHDCCYMTRSTAGFNKTAFGEQIADELPPLPDNFDRQEFRRLRGQKKGKGAGWSLLDWRYYIYSYYRLVELVDAEIGRILCAVQSSPWADDTLVIFSSDHGEAIGHHTRLTKGFLYEEAAGVPTIVSWPGRVESGVEDDEHLVNGVDLASTICDYAGVPEMPGTSDAARSWRPLVSGDAPEWRDYTVVENPLGDPGLGVIGKRYKAMFYREADTMLFDLKEDPGETKNLADDPAASDALDLCRGRLSEYLSRIDVAGDFRASPRYGPERAKRLRDKGRGLKSWYARMGKEN